MGLGSAAKLLYLRKLIPRSIMSKKFKVGKDLINMADNGDDLCRRRRLERLQGVGALSNCSSIIVGGWRA